MLTNQSTSLTCAQPSFNLWAVLDWVFPPFCCNCQKIGFEICPDCWETIDRIQPESACRRCGKLLSRGRICSNCRQTPPAFDQVRSWALYQGAMKNILTGIKYQRRFGLVPVLIPALVESIRAWGINFDLLTAVPLGKKRLRERGYNQADLVARPVAKGLTKPYNSQVLQRVRETRSQVGLNIDERRENLTGAFIADDEICRGKTVLLLDDICTTGATLDACAAALKDAGAEKVYCYTVARTDSLINLNSRSMEVSI